MHVDGHHTAGTGHADEVGHHLGADGGAGAHLAVLAGIAVVGDHSRDAASAGALEGVEHEAELHQVAVDQRGTGGLDNEHVIAAHVVADFNAQLAIAEGGCQSRSKLTAEVVANGFGQLGIGRTRDNLEIAEHGPFTLPIAAAVMVWVWLGWKGSNLRMTEPKPVALPLGYIPAFMGSTKTFPYCDSRLCAAASAA